MNVTEKDMVEDARNDETTEEGKAKEWGVLCHPESGIGEGENAGWTMYATMGKITAEGMRGGRRGNCAPTTALHVSSRISKIKSSEFETSKYRINECFG